MRFVTAEAALNKTLESLDVNNENDMVDVHVQNGLILKINVSGPKRHVL